MENKSIKNRLYQALGQRSPKHPFLLEETTNQLAPVLRPKKMQDPAVQTNGKPAPMYKQGKLLLSSLPSPDATRKQPTKV
jgi:hypothetical protein